MEYSYLDIYPARGIARQLDAEDPECRLVHQVYEEARDYLKIIEDENLRHLKKREPGQLGSEATLMFLRSHERIRTAKHIIQYLLTFLTRLPLEEDIEIEGRTVNPFEQLKAFTIFTIDLIKDKDVTDAILKGHKQLGLLTNANMWYYRGQIDKAYKTLRELADSAKSAVVEDYRKLFLVLQKQATFWFSVRNEEITRVRKNDLFIYKLTRYLLEKYK